MCLFTLLYILFCVIFTSSLLFILSLIHYLYCFKEVQQKWFLFFVFVFVLFFVDVVDEMGFECIYYVQQTLEACLVCFSVQSNIEKEWAAGIILFLFLMVNSRYLVTTYTTMSKCKFWFSATEGST